MNDAIAEILPLALVVTISPLPIVAAILLLFTSKPRHNGLAYVSGFWFGVAAVLGALTWFTSPEDSGGRFEGSTTSATVRIVIGVALCAAAVLRYRRRPPPGITPEMPGWMDGLARFSPPRSLLAGLLVGMGNPKNIATAVAAAVAMSSAEISAGQSAAVVAAYAILATLGVALPLIVLLARGERAQPVLERWREWLAHNNAVVLAVLFGVIGLMLIVEGIPDI